MRTCPSVLRDCALLSAPVGWGRGAYLWAPRRPYIQDFTCLDVNIDPICARPEALPQSPWVSHKTVPNLCAPRSSSTKPLGQPQDCAQQTCLRVASLRSPSQGALWVSHKTVPNKTVYALLARKGFKRFDFCRFGSSAF